MSSTSSTFSGAISESQFSRIQSALLPRWSRWYFFAPTCVLAFVALGTGWTEAIAEPLRALPDVICGLAVFLACALLTRYGRRRTWKNYVRLHGNVSGRIGPTGIEWRTEASTTELPWGKLLGFRLFDDLALVYYAPRCAFFLPRAFFANEQDWAELSNVLSQHSKAI